MRTRPSRRPAAQWARPDATAHPPRVEVLIPTRNRQAALGVTLAGLAAQDDPPFGVVISDQSDTAVTETASIRSMIAVLHAQGRPVRVLRHLPARGMAEQRQFLLKNAGADHVLFLDDDVWLEPGSIARLDTALTRLGCGLVGSAVQGMSYLDDRRPAQQRTFEPWPGAPEPETITRDAPAFQRYELHNAANLLHIASDLRLRPGRWLPYKIAWVGGCVMYRRDALLAVGGFGFWHELPAEHVGEDVLAQWKVMQRFGGAGILPSGAVHLQEPTTLPHREVEASEELHWPQHADRQLTETRGSSR